MAASLIALLASTAPAAAAGRHASMVIDGNTGQVLHAQAAEETRYPASLTKMMTLYIAFELMEQGRITPQSHIRITDEAAGTPPSKLGLPAGTDIAAGDAIKAIVTKSANDMSVALAEHIAGSETKFAILMTRKARELGMGATTFRNAHGLPDGAQVTTARDMLTLALRLNDDFPRHYAYFGLRQFSYNGKTYRNHNTMLGTYPGMDGLKTGYTTASGFNLVASVRRNGKHVVAAVFGGSSAAARNAHMRTILDRSLARASTEKTRAIVADARGARAEKRARAAEPGKVPASTPPALIEPVRPAARPRAEPGGAGAAAATLIAPAPQEAPRMPQRVAEAIRRTDTAAAPAELSPSSAAGAPSDTASGTGNTRAASGMGMAAGTPAETAPVAVAEPVAVPMPREAAAARPAQVEVYKVRPVMVAPRAQPVAAQAASAAEVAAPAHAPTTPTAPGFEPPPRAAPRMAFAPPASFAVSPTSSAAARAPEPHPVAAAPPTLQPAQLATPAKRPFARAQPAQPMQPAAAAAGAPIGAAAAAPSPASPSLAIAAGRGMAPSSLQAQAARLNRGAEPLASTQEPRPPAFRLRGPDPAVASQAVPAASGAAIQIGAYASASEARRQLDAVRARVASLARAQASAEPVQTGGRQLFRARFTGLDAASAATACTALRRQQIDCHVAK